MFDSRLCPPRNKVLYWINSKVSKCGVAEHIFHEYCLYALTIQYVTALGRFAKRKGEQEGIDIFGLYLELLSVLE